MSPLRLSLWNICILLNAWIEAGSAFDGRGSTGQNNGSAIVQKRERLLDCEEQPLDVRVEGPVVVLLGDASQRDKSAQSDIGEEDINSALLFDALVETIEIGQVRDVALNAGYVAAYGRYGFFEFLLATAGNKNISTLTAKRFAVARPIP
jgi:hypothetical protein